MRPEILDKLDLFIRQHVPFQEECEAVYLMVELRKLLDREEIDAPLVRFYCNWTVHTSKSYNDKLMEQVETIIDEVSKTRSADHHMQAFKEQMSHLFEKQGLNEKLFEAKAWNSFIIALVQVLADQPIDKLKGDVSSFCYKPGHKDRIVIEISFSNHRKQIFEYSSVNYPIS